MDQDIHESVDNDGGTGQDGDDAQGVCLELTDVAPHLRDRGIGHTRQADEHGSGDGCRTILMGQAMLRVGRRHQQSTWCIDDQDTHVGPSLSCVRSEQQGSGLVVCAK